MKAITTKTELEIPAPAVSGNLLAAAPALLREVIKLRAALASINFNGADPSNVAAALESSSRVIQEATEGVDRAGNYERNTCL